MAMGFADYYGRNAVAASQVLAGYDDERIRDVLSNVRVGIAIGADAVDCAEGDPLIDLFVRLAARFYPTLVLRGNAAAKPARAALRDLARRINPKIEFADTPTIEVVIGTRELPTGGMPRIFVGSNGWHALVSATLPQRVGRSNNPFGPGAAACLAAANLFRATFQPDTPDLDRDATFPVVPIPPDGVSQVPTGAVFGEVPLIGNGAIGHAAAWALCRVPMNGVVHLVDHEVIDLGNLQRYVLAERADEHAAKVDVLRRYFTGSIKVETHQQRFASFVDSHGSHWSRMLLALDSARDRRAAQASLPKWIGNAWTQPGDLGVSTHDFMDGACVGCLYLPQHALLNEDALIAAALGIPDRVMEVRTLLYNGAGVTPPLLEAIAAAGDIPIERLLPFIGRPVRTLYTEGFCGGAVIPLGRARPPPPQFHLPFNPQPPPARVLLAPPVVTQTAQQAWARPQ